MEQVIAWIVGGLGTALMAVGLWGWNHTHKRIDDAHLALANKVDKAEMDKQRGHTEKIFDNLKTIEISSASIKEQMLRVSSDMESEKRTRAEANRTILNELREIRGMILNRPHRATDNPDQS